MKSKEEQHSSSVVLRKEIQDQSEAEAAALLEQAEKEAQRILDEARAEAEKIKADILKKAEIQAEGVRKRILSSVRLEVKRQALRTREAFVLKIFSSVEEKLEAFRKTKGYLSVLKNLVVEGVLALEADVVHVLPGEVERKLLTKKIFSEVEKEIRQRKKKKVKLEFSGRTIPDAGVILMSSDGRTQFDNRFSTRMERMENAMRLMVVKRAIEKK